MARIRSIHPGLWTDEQFVSVSFEARLFLIGLWTEADDNGVFQRKAKVLRARILPGDALDGEKLLSELEKEGVIKSFMLDDQPLCAIKNFVKWQRPQKPKIIWQLPPDIYAFVRADLRDEDPDTALRRRKWESQDGKCAYCETPITAYSKRQNSLEINHVIPISRGGSDDENNLVATCRTCNRSKGNRTGREFRDDIAKSRKCEATPNISDEDAKTIFAKQREEGGGKRESTTSSLRSDGAAAPYSEPAIELLTHSEPPSAPKPPDPKAHAWAEARRIVGSHCGEDAGGIIGRLLSQLGNDHDALLALFQAAEREQPGHWPSWLTAAAKARKRPSGGFRAYDPVEVWTRPPIGAELGKGADSGHALVRNGVIDVCAQRLLDDARLPDTPRTDWPILAAWLRDGIDYTDAIAPVVRRVAARPGYQPPVSLKFFDAAVRAEPRRAVGLLEQSA